MEWGESLDALISFADQGDIPAALVNRPILEEHLVWIHKAFYDLSGDRPTGATGRISFIAIDAYARRYRIDAPSKFARFKYLITKMDEKFVSLLAERIKQETAAAQNGSQS